MERGNKRKRVQWESWSCKESDHDTVNLEVSLPSGRSEIFSPLKSGTIADLKTSAQRFFAQGFLRLTASDGRLLDPTQSIEHSGLRNGDIIAAVAQQPKMMANSNTLVLWFPGIQGIVFDTTLRSWESHQIIAVTDWESSIWEKTAAGIVIVKQPESLYHRWVLENVVDVSSTMFAHAAILGDGSVMTWGAADFGGDSSEVGDQLRNVEQIAASGGAFAAVLTDGSVVTWGAHRSGGDSSRFEEKLRNVKQIVAAQNAFAAILGDGGVVQWGQEMMRCSEFVNNRLRDVKEIVAGYLAFAALLENGTVVTWGVPQFGGNSTWVEDRLRKVQRVCAALDGAFAAILEDGSVVTWGTAEYGGDSLAVKDRLKNVKYIAGTEQAFAAVLADGGVVTWGAAEYGGDCSGMEEELKSVKQIVATNGAFAAHLFDGDVISWGCPRLGGDISKVRDRLKDVKHIAATAYLFVAMLSSGDIVIW